MRHILGRMIKRRTITTSNIAPDTVTSDKLQDTTIGGSQITSGSITTDKIAADSVTASSLASNAVTHEQITPGSITADMLSDSAIQQRHLSGEIANATTISSEVLDSITGECTYNLPVASGNTITAQDLVSFVNGQISKIQQVQGTFLRSYTPAVFIDHNTSNDVKACALTPTKVLVVYTDSSNSSAGTACILSISNGVVTAGTPAVFNAIMSLYLDVCALTPDKAVVTYQDSFTSANGYACVLSISGSTITPGTPGVFSTGLTYHTAVCALTATKAVVAYRNNSASNQGTAKVLTITDTTVSAGSSVIFETKPVQYIRLCALSSSKAVVAYWADSPSTGSACVLSVSDTTITPGTPAIYENAITYYTSVCALSAEKVIVAYRDHGNSDYGTACILSIDGSTITPGTPTVFHSTAITFTSLAFRSSTSVVVAYTDVTNSSYGTTCNLTITGTSISAGTPIVFESATSNNISICAVSSDEFLVAYTDAGNSNYGTACVVSAAYDVVPGTAATFETGNTNFIGICAVSSNKVLVVYQDASNSSYGTACVLTITNNTITPGTPVVFSSTSTGYPSVCLVADNKALVTYRDVSSYYGRSRILSISGTTVTVGSETIFRSAETTYGCCRSVCTIDENKALVVYGPTNPTALVLSVSGTTITAGTPVSVQAVGAGYLSVARLATNKALFTYQDQTNGYIGKACVLSVSGTTITYGSPITYRSADSQYGIVSALSSTKGIVAYKDNGSSGYVYVCLLSVSGTTVSAGTPVLIEAASSDQISICALTSAHAIAIYSYASTTDYGRYCSIAVNDTTVVPSVPITFGSTNTYYSNICTLSDTQAVVAYKDSGANYGKSMVLAQQQSTPTSYLGIARESKTGGETCMIADLQRSRTISGFSGLTTGQRYYNASNGTLVTVAEAPVRIVRQLSGSFLVGVAVDEETIKVIGRSVT